MYKAIATALILMIWSFYMGVLVGSPSKKDKPQLPVEVAAGQLVNLPVHFLTETYFSADEAYICVPPVDGEAKELVCADFFRVTQGQVGKTLHQSEL
jgi:hypothetical protein